MPNAALRSRPETQPRLVEARSDIGTLPTSGRFTRDERKESAWFTLGGR